MVEVTIQSGLLSLTQQGERFERWRCLCAKFRVFGSPLCCTLYSQMPGWLTLNICCQIRCLLSKFFVQLFAVAVAKHKCEQTKRRNTRRNPI